MQRLLFRWLKVEGIYDQHSMLAVSCCSKMCANGLMCSEVAEQVSLIKNYWSMHLRQWPKGTLYKSTSWFWTTEGWLSEMADKLQSSHGSAYHIISHRLHFQKVCASWISRHCVRKMTPFWVSSSQVIRPPLWARKEKPDIPCHKFWILASSRSSDSVTFLTFSRTSLRTWPEKGYGDTLHITKRSCMLSCTWQFWDKCWGRVSQDVVLLHNSSLPCTASHTVAAVQ
jgi:hypothetical protein